MLIILNVLSSLMDENWLYQFIDRITVKLFDINLVELPKSSSKSLAKLIVFRNLRIDSQPPLKKIVYCKFQCMLNVGDIKVYNMFT